MNIKSLGKYGLDSIGIIDANEANNLLIKLMLSVFNEQSETALSILESCMDELVSKCNILHERQYGSFNVFTILKGELTDKRNELFTLLCNEFIPLTHFNCKLENNQLIYIEK